jgi:hypothetical protein
VFLFIFVFSFVFYLFVMAGSKSQRNRMYQRDSKHDYRSAYSYMITLSKSRNFPPNFSRIFDAQAEHVDFNAAMRTVAPSVKRYIFYPDYVLPSDVTVTPAIRLSDCGAVVRESFASFFKSCCEYIKLRKIVIMPDHIHFIITAVRYLPKHLGYFISDIKKLCSDSVHRHCSPFAWASGLDSIFDGGFHDRIIRYEEMYERERLYLQNNPRRRLVRMLYPEMFSRPVKIILNGVEVSAFGNLDLLENPIIDLLVVRSAFTPEILEQLALRWQSAARQGGVVVSPFISKKEQAMRDMVIAAGGNVIQVCNHGFHERYKPATEWDELMLQGRFLQIGRPEFNSRRDELTRSHAMGLNRFAGRIARSRSKYLLNL